MSAVIRVPASSANLGAGFDVLGMALDLHLDVGSGEPPAGAQPVDRHHPAAMAFAAQISADGLSVDPSTALWVRSVIPMGRGLGFSAAARVGGAALAVVQDAGVQGAGDPAVSLEAGRASVLEVAVRLEGHGDNAAASVCGGVVAWVDGRAIRLQVGPTLAAASVVVWIPETTTSTDRSRRALSAELSRSDVVHNLGRLAQFVLAVEHDDPALLAGATDDRIHQRQRLAAVPDASLALERGVAGGAWCGWLSGSGPTVAFLCDPAGVDGVLAALPDSGRPKVVGIESSGVRVLSSECC